MTYPTIKITDPNTWLVPRERVDEDWIAHVRCEGARFHVFSYSNLGVQCSEKMCIVNKIYQDNLSDERVRLGWLSRINREFSQC